MKYTLPPPTAGEGTIKCIILIYLQYKFGGNPWESNITPEKSARRRRNKSRERKRFL